MAKKTIEQTYQKLSQRDHVLKRSDTYVGSKDLVTQDMWVVDDPDNFDEFKIVKRSITYSPAFIKCFDEVLTNASDHYWRGGGVKYIKIKFDGEYFEVENDGSGIPIEMHKEEKVYVPELIFGHLLAGSNFDDTEERMGGGRNGLGAKLTNIFSTKFIVETADGKKKYKQTFKDNMEESKKSEPSISSSSENYTVIKYWPDFKQFNMKEVDKDTLSLILKRIIDVAAYCPKVRVSWNGKNVPIKSIKDWMEMHIQSTEENKNELFYEQLDKNWEIGIAKTTGMSFEQVSVVNGISTYRGGTHVNDMSRELCKVIYEQLAKKHKKMKFTWMDVRNNIALFLICKVPNPTFDTQSKESLTNNLTKDGTINFNFSDLLIKKILKSEICESIIAWLEAKEAQMLAKESKKNANVKVQKLIDANSKDRSNCILYVYEGESAKSAFRKFRDAQTMGAFPLRGKFINVSEIPTSKVLQNEEAANLMSSMGLHLAGKADLDMLRYGKIYISTDADVDGHSISAALINFFFKFWPELFDLGVVYKVYTPLLVAKQGKNVLYFYTEDEYANWEKKNDVKKWNVEYKKGLGALGDAEYQDMFTSPKAVKITKDAASATNLDCWFGKNSELRKEKLMNA